MSRNPPIRPNRLAGVALLGAAALSGCAGVGNGQQSADLTPISNPAQIAGPQRVSMPLPPPPTEAIAPNSLWRAGAKSFFGDQRAKEIGDILTVNISIADSAQVSNSTDRSRTSSEESGISSLLGLDGPIQKALPGTPSLDPAIGVNSTSSSNGTGTVNRSEAIDLTVAAVIVDKLPNGNLVIGGSQEVRINNELRELLVSGVIRPEDISATNTIQHTQIAEARISYGGRGDLSNLMRQRYGTRFLEQVSPF